MIGSDTTTLRKTAAEVIRNCGLTRMVDANMGSEISAGHNTMFRLEMPRNCEITYCISRQAAQSLGQNGQYIYYDQDMNNVSVYFPWETSIHPTICRMPADVSDPVSVDLPAGACIAGT